MGIDQIRKSDIGTSFERTVQDNSVVVDVSGATLKEIIFQKPDANGTPGAFVTQTAQFTTDGIDGKIRYITIANDLDVIGVWKWQAKVVLGAGTWKTDILEFEVHENLE